MGEVRRGLSKEVSGGSVGGRIGERKGSRRCGKEYRGNSEV